MANCDLRLTNGDRLLLTNGDRLTLTSDCPDANPITLEIRDRGHTWAGSDGRHHVTIRDRGHQLTKRENR